jgi:hypothetical protein
MRSCAVRLRIEVILFLSTTRRSRVPMMTREVAPCANRLLISVTHKLIENRGLSFYGRSSHSLRFKIETPKNPRPEATQEVVGAVHGPLIWTA